ncbi:hypothetical protein NFI96_031871 [Prochilodus magdalenae]|nr:hypothetical protein NFI96_031871 [Prochilodus magdalenae]
MTLSLSPAAVCQCFTLVSLCTSIADPNWINVQNGTHGTQLIYGVAFTLHAAHNITDTDPLGGVNGLGMYLLYALAAACYSAVLLSSSSFLMDFLGVGFSHSRLVSSLHVSTALLCLLVLGISGGCLYVIQENVKKGKLGWLWDRLGEGPSTQDSELQTSPGESLYIEIVGLIFSTVASVFSLCGPSEPIAPSPSVEPGDRAGERTPLIGETGPDQEEWGEFSND